MYRQYLKWHTSGICRDSALGEDGCQKSKKIKEECHWTQAANTTYILHERNKDKQSHIWLFCENQSLQLILLYSRSVRQECKLFQQALTYFKHEYKHFWEKLTHTQTLLGAQMERSGNSLASTTIPRLPSNLLWYMLSNKMDIVLRNCLKLNQNHWHDLDFVNAIDFALQSRTELIIL